jgi:acetylornithine deacetylase/succinyl-diaminopimelate desuccinylase-like protein
VRQVLCGEPTGLQLYDAHKGYAVVRCTLEEKRPRRGDAGPAEEVEFHGKAAHSSTPHLGINAIAKAAAWAKQSGARVLAVSGGASANTVPALCTLLVQAARPASLAPERARPIETTAQPDLSRLFQLAASLSELWRSLLGRLSPQEDARFDPPGAVGGFNLVSSAAATAAPSAESVTLVKGVTLFDKSVTPSGASITLASEGAALSATFDARLLPQHDPDALFALFTAAASSWVEKLSGGEVSLTLSIERNAAGMSLPEGAPLVAALGRTLSRLGLDPRPLKKPTSTEAGVFARAGCEAVVLGPGQSTGNAHTANERIELGQLERAIDLYTAILEDLCASQGA